MRHMRKWFAALLALCLLLGALGAAAEEDRLNDLLGYYQRETGKSSEEVAPVEEAFIPGGEAPAEEAPIEALETPVLVEDLAVNASLPDGWTNILLLGTDSRTSQNDTRTDTMIILSVNPASGQVKLTSLMRDLWVEIPGHGGAKLNAACVYGGPELTVRCVNENFGLNIETYVLVNMQCLAAIVDSLGGIRMDVSDAEAEAINKLFSDDLNANDENAYFVGEAVSAGSQVLLNGKQALAYARIRSLDSDYARTDRQRQVLVTIAKQLQTKDLFTLGSLVMSMMQYVETNMGFDDIMTLASTGLNADLDGVTELRLPVEGTYQSGTFSGTWCIRADYEANTALLHQFIYED